MDESCAVCEEPLGDIEIVEYFVCRSCRNRYAPTLIKANFDEFGYWVQLAGGAEFEFESVTLHGDWVHLNNAHLPGARTILGRGIDVQVDQIVAVRDTGH